MSTLPQLSIPRYDYDDLVEMHDVFSNDSTEVFKFLTNLTEILNSVNFSNNYEISKLRVYLAELNVSKLWEHVSAKKFTDFSKSITQEGLKLVECFLPEPHYSSKFKAVIDSSFSVEESLNNKVKLYDVKGVMPNKNKASETKSLYKTRANKYMNVGKVSGRIAATMAATSAVRGRSSASGRMNKRELVNSLAQHTGTTHVEAAEFVNAFVETVRVELKRGNEVTIPGFGQFVAKHRPSREMRNPATGKVMMSKAKTSATFKPSAGLKDL